MTRKITIEAEVLEDDGVWPTAENIDVAVTDADGDCRWHLARHQIKVTVHPDPADVPVGTVRVLDGSYWYWDGTVWCLISAPRPEPLTRTHEEMAGSSLAPWSVPIEVFGSEVSAEGMTRDHAIDIVARMVIADETSDPNWSRYAELPDHIVEPLAERVELLRRQFGVSENDYEAALCGPQALTRTGAAS